MNNLQEGTQRNYTRKELMDFCANGRGSVILGGVHYLDPGDVPSESVLAGDDPARLRSALDQYELDIQRQLAEMSAIRDRLEASKNAPKSALPEDRRRVGHPLVAGPVPAEGPVPAAPLDLRPGAHYGDGHDPNAVPEPSMPFVAGSPNPAPLTINPAMRPGGVVQTGGVQPPHPMLNSPNAHEFQVPPREQQQPKGQQQGSKGRVLDPEEEAAGKPEVPRSITEILSKMTDEEKAKALAAALAAQGEKPKEGAVQGQNPAPSAAPIKVSSEPAK